MLAGSPALRRHLRLHFSSPPPPPLYPDPSRGGGGSGSAPSPAGGGRVRAGSVGPPHGGALVAGSDWRRRSQRRQRPLCISLLLQAIEKATQNQQIVNAIGKPIVRGPWYSASIAVNHAKHSVSCTFPVSAPQGSGLLKFKAVRLGDESWYSFLQPSDWEILIMDAILDIHTEDGKHRTVRVTISDNTPAPPPADCTACKSHTAPSPPPPPPPPAKK
ncbi:unnamed protein product [Urochloa humidicola]